jgi:4-hydroxybenzoate polyprenyltransferase
MEWIKALRLPAGLLFAVLTFVVAKDTELQTRTNLWLLAGTVLAITSATMYQNDMRDRVHDAKKGKRLALERPRQFRGVTVGLWMVAVSLTFVIGRQDFPSGILLTAMIAMGLVYSETRRVPLLPITITAVTSASPVLFAVIGGNNSARTYLLFATVAAIMFAREILKDMEDIKIDEGYKWTLPVTFGAKSALVIAEILLGVGAVGILFISSYTIPSVIFLGVATLYLRHGIRHIASAKMFVDGGVTAILAALFVL